MTRSDEEARRSPERPRPRRVRGGGDAAPGGLADPGIAGGTGRSSGGSDRERDPLGEALRALPAETAGAGFAARVLARLDEDERVAASPALRPAAAWAMLAVAGLVAAVGVAVTRPGGPPAAESARIAGLPAADPSGEGAPPVTDGRGPAVPGSPETAEPSLTAGALPSTGEEPDGARSGGDTGEDRSPGSRGASGTTRRERARSESSGSAGDARLASSASAAPPPSDARASLARLRAELDALRRDHRRLEIGLSELPEVGRDGQPVIYVGGDEGLELVLDLGRGPARGGDPRGERPAGTSL